MNQIRESEYREVNYKGVRYSLMDTAENAEEMVVMVELTTEGLIRRCVVPKQLKKLALLTTQP